MNAPISASTQVPENFLRELEMAAGGPGSLLSDAHDREPYLVDFAGRNRGEALAIVRPSNTAQVAAVVRLCVQHGVPIVPQGGNTGMVGGATIDIVPGAVLLSLRRMNRVRQIDLENNTITVEAGCVLADVQQAAREAGRLYPLSLAAEGSCTVGGNVSTNAGGVQVLRYGNTRDLTLGVEVVLPDGQIWDGLRGLRKDNTGYDLKQLFIAGEGTLGVVTAVVLKLFALPQQSQVAWVGVPTPASAVRLLRRLQAEVGDRVTAYELLEDYCLDLLRQHDSSHAKPLQSPWHVLMEFSEASARMPLRDLVEAALGQAMEEGLATDAVLATSEAQAATLWSIRESIPEATRALGLRIRHDVSVPISAIPEFIESTPKVIEQRWPGARILCFGHVGDGNLHYNVFHPDAATYERMVERSSEVSALIYDAVAARQGSISAEHGLGRAKNYLLPRYRSSVEIELQRRVKAALDPRGLMNPGKVLPPG